MEHFLDRRARQHSPLFRRHIFDAQEAEQSNSRRCRRIRWLRHYHATPLGSPPRKTCWFLFFSRLGKSERNHYRLGSFAAIDMGPKSAVTSLKEAKINGSQRDPCLDGYHKQERAKLGYPCRARAHYYPTSPCVLGDTTASASCRVWTVIPETDILILQIF